MSGWLHGRSGRLTSSAACLHAVVPAFAGLFRASHVSARRRGKESLLIRRDAVRLSHQLDSVVKSSSLFVGTPPLLLSRRISAPYIKITLYSVALALRLYGRGEPI